MKGKKEKGGPAAFEDGKKSFKQFRSKRGGGEKRIIMKNKKGKLSEISA